MDSFSGGSRRRRTDSEREYSSIAEDSFPLRRQSLYYAWEDYNAVAGKRQSFQGDNMANQYLKCLKCGRTFDRAYGAYYIKQSRRYICPACWAKMNPSKNRPSAKPVQQSERSLGSKILDLALLVFVLGFFAHFVWIFDAFLWIIGIIVLRRESPKKDEASVNPLEPEKAVETLALSNAETFKVTGTSYQRENIQSLGELNEDYYLEDSELLDSFDEGDEIFKCKFPDNLTVTLADEPENPYDSNAIRVELNGVKVGYIQKEKTDRVKNLWAQPDVKIKAEIYAGPLKEVYKDDDGKISVEQKDLDFGIRLLFYA